MMFRSVSAVVLALLATSSLATPLSIDPRLYRREDNGQKLVEVSKYKRIPGTATVRDLSQNDCNTPLKDGELALLVSRKFARAAPGSSAADNGLCGRLDATLFVVTSDGTILDQNTQDMAVVGLCDDCEQEGDVIINQATFEALGGKQGDTVIESVYPRFG